MVGSLILFTLMAPPADFAENFESGMSSWQAHDKTSWKVKSTPFGNVLSLIKQSHYEPPHRSPYNIILLQDHKFGDFELTALARSTKEEYGHRDLCVFFGWQSPDRFYYVHFGQKTDDRANQIFIVNQADRTKISHQTTPGSPWDDKWHKIRVRRENGVITTYFDDMTTPAMIANDDTFGVGLVGLGSFDDTGDFDQVSIKRL